MNLLILIGLIVTMVQSNQEPKRYTTSMTDKLALLNLDRKLIRNLNNHLDEMKKQNKKIGKLRRLNREFEKGIRLAEGREEEFLSNPLNMYYLIRHLHMDWPILSTEFIQEKRFQLPQKEDLEKASEAMRRIQRIFQLIPNDMAKGLLNGEQYDAKLMFLDCNELGRHYLRVKDVKNATEWFLIAREMMDKLKPKLIESYKLLNATRSKISLSLARSLFAQGLLEEAGTEIKLEPELNPRLLELLKTFVNYARRLKKMVINDAIAPRYSQLCAYGHKPKSTRHLCSYKRNPSEFLQLAPLKQEVLSMDPYVVVFHDVIYDSEIMELQRVCEPILEPTSIKKVKDPKQIVSKDRTANGVWIIEHLKKPHIELMKRIDRRISDMSDLLIDFTKRPDVQFLDYDFGGHFAPHIDFTNSSKNADDRIATMLLYLNDVPQGGETVFLHLDIVVRPEKGKALFFNNIAPGTNDYEERSLHAACPVIIGKKQIISHWIHELNQMFLRPCFKPPVNRYTDYDKKSLAKIQSQCALKIY